MKTDYEMISDPRATPQARTHRVTFTGTTDEFKLLIDALQLSSDNRVQNLAGFLQKKIPQR